MQGTPKDQRKYSIERKISIQVQDDQDRDKESKLQREQSQNTSPSFQPTTTKPPSGSQTLPTPRKHYHARNERIKNRHGGEANQTMQLPFGGGQEFENIQAELQVVEEQIILFRQNTFAGSPWETLSQN